MKNHDDFTALFPGDAAAFEGAMREPSPVSLRLNGAKIANEATALSSMATDGRVGWCGAGRYLAARPRFTQDPLFHAGAYYVQEAASMFVEQCFKKAHSINPVSTALDLCAAPGGKATHLAALLATDGMLVANETIRSRTGALHENLARWGSPRVVITNNDPADFAPLRSFFDFVLVDAPCSGEGMFRKDADARAQWSAELVRHCAARQRRILAEAWRALRPGGFLAYSTCTYNRLENEGTAAFAVNELGAECVALDLDPSWGVETSEAEGVIGYRFYPYQARSEGFFCCLLRKSGSDSGSRTAIHRKNRVKEHDFSRWFGTRHNLMFTEHADRIRAFPRDFAADLDTLCNALRVTSAGVDIAVMKGRDLNPTLDAALCDDFLPDAFPTLEVDADTALRYLRRESIALPSDVPTGHLTLTHRHIIFGLVKNLGSRVNSLLPPSRRVRS